MLRRRFVLVFALILGLVLPLLAQNKDKDKAPAKKEATKESAQKEPAKKDEKDVTKEQKANLKWKFEKGKPFYQRMKTVTEQTMQVMNSPVKQKQEQTFYFSWTPTEIKGDVVQIEQKIEGVVMDIDISGTKISYDSTKEAPANNPLGEFFKALSGSKFVLTLNTKEMKVTKIEGRDDFLKKLVQANPSMKALLEKILSEKALIEMAEPTFGALPNGEKTKGQTWTRSSTLDMGPIGTYENKYTYTYEGKDEKKPKLDKIKVEATLTYKEPGQDAGVGGLPFKIKSANLKSTGANGVILYNPDKGRIEASTMKLELKGDLNIEIGGQTTKVDLSQTQNTDIETMDENPIKKK